jgi:hypothetical protein
MNGWLGEVQGLQISLDAAKRKLASLDRSTERNHHTRPTDLGMPSSRRTSSTVSASCITRTS